MEGTVLVTGGAGFIGAHVARALLAAGFRVVVLDDLSGGHRRNVPDGAEFVEGSILDDRLLNDLFARHRFRFVYHLAAYAAEGLSHFIRRFNYMNNVVGSVNLVNEAVRHDVECFVFTSSIAVYGAIEPPMHEGQAAHPEDPYGIAKYAVEQDLEAARRMFGLPYVIFRPHNVYGEFQNVADPYRNVVGIFMNQIMKGAPMSVFGDGTQRRAFSYVGDVAPVIAAGAWTPGARNQVFNVGADEAVSVGDLAHAVARAMGAPGHEVINLPERQEVQFAWADHSRCQEVFGAPAMTPLADGLARMAAWVREEGPRATPPFGAIELERGLPPSWRALQERRA